MARTPKQRAEIKFVFPLSCFLFGPSDKKSNYYSKQVGFMQQKPRKWKSTPCKSGHIQKGSPSEKLPINLSRGANAMCPRLSMQLCYQRFTSLNILRILSSQNMVPERYRIEEENPFWWKVEGEGRKVTRGCWGKWYRTTGWWSSGSGRLVLGQESLHLLIVKQTFSG